MLLARFSAVSRALTGVFVATLVLTALAACGLVLDPRVIAGAPAWLKPLKFAISIAIYALSFAWLLGHVRGRPRLVRWLTGATAAVLALELAIIFLQAARGTRSHFNVSTPLDAALYSTMGAGITLLWLCQIAAAILLLRERLPDPVLAWSLRFAIVLAALGSGVGYLMTAPQPEQLEAARHGAGLIAGAHSVGGPDGGPGLPLVGWSRDHGDLRAAHFFGIHALQIVPVFGIWLGRLRDRLDDRRRVALLWAFCASYLGALLLLVWQALRGQPVGSLDEATLAALLGWLAATIAAGTFALSLRPSLAEAR